MKCRFGLLLWGALVVGAVYARAARPKPEDIVKQMLHTYRSAKTYTETATETLTVMKEKSVTTHRFSYAAPNKFYYDVKEKGKLLAAIASDGETMQVFNRRQGLNDMTPPAKLSDLKKILERLGLETENDPFSFLVGYDPMPKGTKVTLVKIDKIAGKAMYQLELKQPDGRKKTFWIGRDDHLLYRVRQVVVQTRGGVTETVTVEETHSGMKLNGVLPPEAFTIASPS